jgi:hypothetical protein
MQLNVFLPDAPAPRDITEELEMKTWIEDTLFEANAFCAVVGASHKISFTMLK